MMNPSRRIPEIAIELAADLFEDGTHLVIKALVQYLDERESLETRREQVRYAMACIRAGALTEASRIATALGLNPLRLTHEQREHEYEIGLYKLAQEAGIFPPEPEEKL